jgi:hypothetical protein
MHSATESINPTAMAQNTITEKRLPTTFLDGFVSTYSSACIGLLTNETGDTPNILDKQKINFVSYKQSLHIDNLYII